MLAALTAQHLSTGVATQAYVYTTDIAAGEGTKIVSASHGYGDTVSSVSAFRFIESLHNRQAVRGYLLTIGIKIIVVSEMRSELDGSVSDCESVYGVRRRQDSM